MNKLRRYGTWAGNPNGVLEDPTLCIESVRNRFNRFLSSQCSRRRGHGPDGLYCRQHAKRAEEHAKRAET